MWLVIKMENVEVEVLVEDFLEDDIEILDFVDMGYSKRMFLRPNYYIMMSEIDFFRRIRLTKNTVMTLLIQIEDQSVEVALNSLPIFTQASFF